VKSGKFVQLSYEQIVDCSGAGCTGSSFEQIYQYLIKAGGLEDAQSYPPSGAGGQCHFDPSKIVAKVSGYVNVESKNEQALQQAVATIGPIGVAIDASHSSFQLYTGGGMYHVSFFLFYQLSFKMIYLVYNEAACSQVQLDQSLLVVGYGSQSNTDFWIVRNRYNSVCIYFESTEYFFMF